MHKTTTTVILNAAVTVAMCLAAVGCGKTTGPTTEAGLRDQNQVLLEKVRDQQETITDLNRQIQSLRGEMKEAKVGLAHDSDARMESWKTAHAEELASQTRAAAQREEVLKLEIVQLKEANASLKLENGAIRREVLALNEITDSQPRIANARESRWRAEQVVVYLFLGIALLLLGVVALRYHSARDRLNLLAMQQVAQLGHLGGDT